MSNEKDRIVKFTGEEIEINDNQKKPVNEELLPPIDENIDALLFPARTIDTKICNLTVDINEKLAQIDSLCGTAISCGCATTLTRTFVGYERIRIDRQDSEDRTHTGVNPFSVGIFGATSNLTTGIGSDTVVNVGDLGRGIKTEKIILSGVGNTAMSATVNAGAASSCPGITCSGLASSVTTLTSELNALRDERDNLLSVGGNDLKGELKIQYQRRHGLVFGLAETEKDQPDLKLLNLLWKVQTISSTLMDRVDTPPQICYNIQVIKRDQCKSIVLNWLN